jgi:hypothetical protein
MTCQLLKPSCITVLCCVTFMNQGGREELRIDRRHNGRVNADLTKVWQCLPSNMQARLYRAYKKTPGSSCVERPIHHTHEYSDFRRLNNLTILSHKFRNTRVLLHHQSIVWYISKVINYQKEMGFDRKKWVDRKISVKRAVELFMEMRSNVIA